MLPKQNRLTKKPEFDFVLQKGSIIQSRHFGLAVAQQTENKKSTRIGFIISNKISKKAVERNRVRRILRSIFREFIPKLSPGYLLVVLAKKSILEEQSQELQKQLELALKRARAL